MVENRNNNFILIFIISTYLRPNIYQISHKVKQRDNRHLCSLNTRVITTPQFCIQKRYFHRMVGYGTFYQQWTVYVSLSI
jgi:hypothetical protein